MLKTLHSDSTFLVVQDSSLILEVGSVLSSQVCFFTFGISLGMLPVQKRVFDLAHTSQTEYCNLVLLGPVLARWDHCWQPKVVWGDHFWQPKSGGGLLGRTNFHVTD